MADDQPIEKLKKDLKAIHSDWQQAAHDKAIRNDLDFLEKFAHDIIMLDQDAQSAQKTTPCKAKATLVHHLLSTPWGAPFISNMTLIEAAQLFKKDPKIPGPFYLMVENFARFESKFKSQIFDIFDDLSEEI